MKKSAEEVSAIRRKVAIARWSSCDHLPTSSIRIEAALADRVRAYAKATGNRSSDIVSAAVRAFLADGTPTEAAAPASPVSSNAGRVKTRRGTRTQLGGQ